MAIQTTNLRLTLPIGTEQVSRQVINTNMELIDSAIGAVPEGKNIQEEIEYVQEHVADLIDDTAGAGDVDKVWSADKVKKTKADVIDETIDTPSAVMTFADGADGMPMAVKIGIESVQDLHGMPYPYPAGVTNNMIPDGTDTSNGYVADCYLKSDGTTASDINYYISEYFAVTAGETYTFSNKSGTANAVSVCFYDENKTFISGINANLVLSRTIEAPVGAVYARCSQVYKNNSYDNLFQFELGSTATTLMWYSNICPITGETKKNIHRTGANLFDPEKAPGDNGYIKASNGEPQTASSGNWRKTNFIPVKEGETYHLGFVLQGGTNPGTAFYSSESSSSYIAGIRHALVPSNQNITAPKGAKFMRTSIPIDTGYNPNWQNTVYICRVGDLTSFEPFTGDNIYSITFPQSAGTVYGGRLAVNKDGSGKLIVDRQFYSFDGTEGWKLSSGNMVILDNVPSSINTENICSHFVTKPVSSTGNVLYTSGNWIVAAQGLIIDGEAIGKYQAALTKFKNYLAAQYTNGTPVQYAVKLETGTEYIMTASEVNALLTSLKGLNNIWADTGDVLSVEYSADTKLYIDNKNDEQDATASATQEMIADSDLPVATENHASGDVFICNNQLVRATASIATGDTINTGSGGNAEVKNIVDLIAEVVTSVGGVATDLSNVKGYTGPDPDAVLTKGAYIQNAEEQAVAGRNIGIKNGVITFKNTASSIIKCIYLTNTLSGTSGTTLANCVPTLSNLEQISKITGITHFRLQVKNNGNELTKYPFMGFMFCSVNSETDAITVLQRVYIGFVNTKKIMEITIPEGTTHYAFFIYQSDAYACDFTLYPKFMCLYDINE